MLDNLGYAIKKVFKKSEKPDMIYHPVYHVSSEDFKDSEVYKSISDLKDGDILVVEDFMCTERDRGIVTEINNAISQGTYDESKRKLEKKPVLTPQNEYKKMILSSIQNKKVNVFLEPTSSEAENYHIMFSEDLTMAKKLFYEGRINECTHYITDAIHSLAKHAIIRDNLTKNLIDELSEKYPTKNIVIERGNNHILNDLLYKELNSKYKFKEIQPKMGLSFNSVNELARREALGEKIGTAELKLSGLRGIVAQEITGFFSGSSNYRVKLARRIADNLSLEEIQDMSRYVSKGINGNNMLLFKWLIEHEKTK